ncbi:hypothetical protein ACHWQZ_G015382 [Mnemiopsis leidyi]
MVEKSLIGLIAAAASTLAIFIALCIWGVYGWSSSVLNLLAFLAGGLATVIRLLTVIDEKGVVNLEFLRSNKKNVTLATIAVGGLCCLLSFIAAVIAAKDYGMASDFGFSLNGSYYFALVCVFLGCFASAGNVVLAFLDMREQQQAPPPAS